MAYDSSCTVSAGPGVHSRLSVSRCRLLAIGYWLSVTGLSATGRIRQKMKAQPGRAISGFKISPSRPDNRKPGASLADA